MAIQNADHRLSGVLLHPTCLPGTPGIGTIGKQAYRFIDVLKAAKQSLWQILPIGPTGYGDSPYASFSTFAGNPLLIDLDMLVESGWAQTADIIPPDYIRNNGIVDFGSVVWWKMPLLRSIAGSFTKNAAQKDKDAYAVFSEQNAFWLNDYALFMSIKDFYDVQAQKEGVTGARWNNYWPKDLASCEKNSLMKWQSNHKDEIEVYKVIQFFFFQQWMALKKYANDNGVSIIGDIPIFVASDSSDVWSNQKLFLLDDAGQPLVVAGVPPDYFSANGQLWGNPLYDWDAMKKEHYHWWIARIRHMLHLVDYVRIDHFRGFEAYWAVPAGEETAINGKWEPGPKHDLFYAIRDALGDIPIIAEDLGLITEGVRALRDDFNLPGMKILQFAFDMNEAGQHGMTNAFLPHMYIQNCVVYTGTHDNQTMQGWLNSASDEEITLISEYIGGPGASFSRTELCRRLVQEAIASCADFAVIPLQDLFGVGDEGRINTPSTADGKNWVWRMTPEMLNCSEQIDWLRRVSELYGRNVAQK